MSLQEACKELLDENMNSKEYSEDQPPRDICLNGFLDVLHELKFGVLEAEYHLSRRLHLVRTFALIFQWIFSTQVASYRQATFFYM